MWQWLNANAGGVQALSSALGFVVTVALVGITAWYVSLTKDLADVAKAQLKGQAEAAESRRCELAALLDLFKIAIDSLPYSIEIGGFEEMIRRSPDLEKFDLNRFLALAAEIGRNEGGLAAEIVSNLKWLNQYTRGIKGTPRERGYQYRDFPGQQWNMCWLQVQNLLGQLAKTAEAVQQTPASN